MINRLSRRMGASLLSALLAVLLCLAAFPKAARADQADIDAELIARMRNVVAQLAPTGGTTWEKYLNKRFYIATKLDATGATLNWDTTNDVPSTWKWSGATATLDAPTAVGKPDSPKRKPYYDGGSRTYYVYSGEQLKFALDSLSGSAIISRSISIQENIDLNGQAGKVWPCINELRHVTILGNGHTIYNLRVDDSHESRTAPNTNANEYAAFIGRGIALTMRNLTFSNANICSDYTATEAHMDLSYRHSAGIIGWPSSTVTGKCKIEDVTVKNFLVVGAAQVGALSGRTYTADNTAEFSLKNCYAENNICFGEQHVSSLSSSLNNLDSAEYCYSIGSIVISTAGHSGGLFSCGIGVGRISDCFVDAEVYGSKTTGVFAGAMSGVSLDGTLYSRCFASGYVEGMEDMGGFIGYLPKYNMTFRDCYSTALVGLRSNGTNIGGFLGRREGASGSGSIQNMTNCYAAGETGYTGLDCSRDSTAPRDSHIGGMIGNLPGHLAAASNCYYDKQATGMREWGVGSISGSVSADSFLTGVMTTDSAEGPGLTSTNPGGDDGFSGFTSGEWDYTAVNHYPELRAFKFASAANWGGSNERANLVKAYSLSSTATMLLDTWDYGLNKSTGEIDVRGTMNEWTYDTVRDLTSSFTLTANLVDNWDRIGDQDSKTHGESTSEIAGETLDVLSLKAVNGQYICDELVPGIEWLMVTCSVGGQTATRRIRVIPTASLDAGLNAVITGLYDHADDVKLFYSTGVRIEGDRSDVTTGIFPDMADKSNAISDLQNQMLNNAKNTYDKEKTKTGNDIYFGAEADYMGKSGENAAESEIYVYIYKVTDIDAATNQILTGDRITLTDENVSPGASQFNGYDLLENTDQRYLIEYMWELEDGRVLSDAKMVRRAEQPFDVILNLYQNTISPATLYPDGGYLYTGVNKPSGSRLPLTDFSDITTDGRQAATDAGDAEYRETAQTAWKIKNPAETMTRVQLIMQNGNPAIRSGEVFSQTIDNPSPGQTISLPTVTYRIVYRNGGFYTIPEHVTRSYVLQYDDANQTWHLEFDKYDEASPENIEILFNDVENCITVNVVVRRSADPEDAGSVDIPQTGDRQQPYLWFGLILLAIAGLMIAKAAAARCRKKKPPESR